MNIPLVLAPVIVACEEQWPNYQSDCSGFVKAVAASLGVTLTGQANDIVDQIQRVPWTTVKGGRPPRRKPKPDSLSLAALRTSPTAML